MGNAAEGSAYVQGAGLSPIPFVDAHMLEERIESRMRGHEETCFAVKQSEAQDVHGHEPPGGMEEGRAEPALFPLGFKIPCAAVGVVIELFELVAEAGISEMQQVALQLPAWPGRHEFLVRAVVVDAYGTGPEQPEHVVACQIVFPAKIGKTWSFNAGVSRFATGADVDGAVTFGVYYQLTKRRGHTRSSLRRMARQYVTEERNPEMEQ